MRGNVQRHWHILACAEPPQCLKLVHGRRITGCTRSGGSCSTQFCFRPMTAKATRRYDPRAIKRGTESDGSTPSSGRVPLLDASRHYPPEAPDTWLQLKFQSACSKCCSQDPQIWLYKADMLMRSEAGFGGVMSVPQKLKWKTRLVQHGFPDRSFDIEFWQEQGDEAIFSAAWEMVVLAEETNHGRKPRLQRTATTLKRV